MSQTMDKKMNRCLIKLTYFKRFSVNFYFEMLSIKVHLIKNIIHILDNETIIFYHVKGCWDVMFNYYINKTA